MSVIFECEYKGRRYAGLGLPADGAFHELYAVREGQLRDALVAGSGPADVAKALRAGGEVLSVAVGDRELRFLPPLLPTSTNNSLINGFMGTHRSKFDRAPEPDEAFAAPNYYIKGFGSWLRMPDEPLVTPADPLWLLEEPEVVLVYVNDDEGTPHYAGYTFGNDLNDIGLHLEKPWAWTPYAKLCETSIAPWLFLEDPPAAVSGRVVIEREGATAWEGAFSCGADSIFQRFGDMTQYLFSYPALRRPGLVNYLFMGADKATYHDGFRIEDGDRMVIDVTSHGVSLPNVVRFGPKAPPAVRFGPQAASVTASALP
ncbi:fumarylacetoacetate (FAA) hydrolase [Streptomyces sp. NBC_01218]|uniref:fumarylacetoacetate (FAA) hydrolase n=1 Tax=Streptomyces sp. NBC_01218 TaxID=2903780 RepID=UPI002E0F4F70|nr:fumarylacetoacetate (FAA) hydrolase [Streptomyces sp. NBC_01218]WSQ55091.1 fumarylacetoacetate (FAA) hydrolase [Streptomyces sp. NBC_01218]